MQLLVLLFALGTALGQDYIDGQYFIRLNNDLVQTNAQENAFIEVLKSDFNIELHKLFRLGEAKSLFVKGSADDVARAGLLKEVKHVVQDSYAYATQDCGPTASPGTWGLDRLDQTEQLTSNDPLNGGATYMYGANNGFNVRAYVMDTGIDIDHSNFGGRAFWGYAGDGITNPDPGDINGHGTHCAGTIGSDSYGVARATTLIAVKILNDSGSGPWSAIIDGLDWVNTRDPARGDRSVVSMSVGGGGQNTEVQAAIDALVASGVTCVVSAGNSNTNACTQTPAFVPSAITVGASDVEDVTASFSNYGQCVDIYGPGVDVLSTQPGESTAVFSGTSMSCPHVAGAVSRYQSSQATAPSPDDVVTYLTGQATQDALTFFLGQDPTITVNLLLFLPCP